MRINRVRLLDVAPRDEIVELIQDFDTIAQKLTAAPKHRMLNARWQPRTAPVNYVRRRADLAPATRRRAKYGALAKSIVIAGFLAVGAVFGTLIS
jgi:hypothetical protein